MIELETDDDTHLLIEPTEVVHFEYRDRDDGIPNLEIIYSSGTNHMMDVTLSEPERAKQRVMSRSKPRKHVKLSKGDGGHS